MDKKNRTYIRIIILGVLLVALIFAIYSSVVKDPGVVKAGDEAPNFSLQQLNGSNVKLTDLRGKGVVLNFWGTWCEPCKTEMPALQKQYEALKDKGLVVVGVNIGETEVAVDPFVKSLGVQFPILMDRKSDVTKLYKIGQIPASYFIDEDGVVRDIFVGQMSEEFIADKVAKILP
ncbi:thiol-disulfide oxidoreductase ResA [Brevibacillus fulvus]|uniref:Peroxiredoxin n=1 Tax=Brevibacillus fulvus TaxID=1125967 RepID=A0A938XVW0_9BACL|nr:thiol-disulfide oxidoreductase ResA [Brevibacillus fulvus]MBM7588658.1 peroxiredoxin [Brevibacillus fulvus]